MASELDFLSSFSAARRRPSATEDVLSTWGQRSQASGGFQASGLSDLSLAWRDEAGVAMFFLRGGRVGVIKVSGDDALGDNSGRLVLRAVSTVKSGLATDVTLLGW